MNLTIYTTTDTNDIEFRSGPPGSYMVSRMREMWPGNGDEQNDLLNLVQRNRMSMVSCTTLNRRNNINEIISDAKRRRQRI